MPDIKLAADLVQNATSIINQTLREAVANITLSDEGVQNLIVPFTTASDLLINWRLDVSEANLIMILSNQSGTIETNANDATGGNTITITANKPFLWIAGGGITSPFVEDVTKIYWTRTSGSDAKIIQIISQEDATP